MAGTACFLASLGYELDLFDASADVFVCGECIEHVEDTNSFLTELCRVMNVAIFTLPNATPCMYRQLNIRWCVRFEHVALMSVVELKTSLETMFSR